MNFLKKNLNGILVCFVIAVPSWLLGKTFPVVGGPVIAILAGMLITLVWTNKGKAESGIKWTSKIILQTAVVLLGFGMNLGVILQTGKQSLPIIVCTISTSLIIAWLLRKIIKVPSNTSILVGVGSSICGGSAIAATAPVIDADDTEVAQAISVIFFFNVIAAVLFPVLGSALGFDTTGGGSFGLFAGTAINDTSSVTAGRLYLGQYVEPWKRDTEYCCYGKAYTYTGNYSDHTGIIPDPCKICLKSRNC